MDWHRYRLDWGGSIRDWIDFLAALVAEPRGLFWWPTMLVALLGAAALLYAQRHGAGIARAGRPHYAAFLRELPVDVACLLGYTYTQVLIAPLLAGVVLGGTGLVMALGDPGVSIPLTGFAADLALGMLAFVFGDLCLYWSHRLFHMARPLWVLHVLHHRPQVLTPITAFRFWPPEAACHFAAFSFGQGVAFGMGALLLGVHVTPLTYAGVNVLLLAWYLAFSHLRHSHVALYFPGWLSRILVSPHMHQAHHSIDPSQHNRNFGTALALWDWVFGTLYVPDKTERFRFGVAEVAVSPASRMIAS